MDFFVDDDSETVLSARLGVVERHDAPQSASNADIRTVSGNDSSLIFCFLGDGGCTSMVIFAVGSW